MNISLNKGDFPLMFGSSRINFFTQILLGRYLIAVISVLTAYAVNVVPQVVFFEIAFKYHHNHQLLAILLNLYCRRVTVLVGSAKLK